MALSKERREIFEKYIAEHYISDAKMYDGSTVTDTIIKPKRSLKKESASNYSGLYDDFDKLVERVNRELEDTWQQSFFDIIEEKHLDSTEVYKRAYITKQTFFKIKSDAEYHPSRDTAIMLCIGLKLNLDETQGLLGKAGYFLSASLTRDLIIRCCIDRKEYDILEIDAVLEDFKEQPLLVI